MGRDSLEFVRPNPYSQFPTPYSYSLRPKMRAEIAALSEQIESAVALLRRRL